MNQSENINELAAALAKAQSQITGALKESKNPFFKSSYADLASCWDACRKQLTENGLSIIQTTEVVAGIDGTNIRECVVTTLAHSSGQWIRGYLPIKAKDDGPQAQGSGITYARRYALAAIVGLAQIDDDAEAAQARDKPNKAAQTRSANEHADRISEACRKDNLQMVRELVAEGKDGGSEYWTNVWVSLPANVKHYIKDNMKDAA